MLTIHTIGAQWALVLGVVVLVVLTFTVRRARSSSGQDPFGSLSCGSLGRFGS